MRRTQTVRVLGIESSCDETAAAVVEDGVRVLSSVVATQHDLHQHFGGVVPEIACRAHIESVLPVVTAALDGGAMALGDVDAVAVTNTPGLIGALLIGVTAAKALSWALGVPLAAVNHLHAHIYSAWLAEEETAGKGGEPPGPHLPAVSLVVSGGHTSLFLTEGPTRHALLSTAAWARTRPWRT
ncbi:MAG: tRNA (adenosine(37)-N6)-threonylcarbamoyltransferase complex transferase subunit TsaD [Planctomycetota bacterium]